MRRLAVPVSYRILKDTRLVIHTADGAVTDAELLAHQQRLQRDPEFDVSDAQLCDFRTADLGEVSFQGLKILAQNTACSRGSRRAIVVGSDLGYGLARTYEAYREGSEDDVRVFRDVGNALTWLELD